MSNEVRELRSLTGRMVALRPELAAAKRTLPEKEQLHNKLTLDPGEPGNDLILLFADLAELAEDPLPLAA